MNESSRNEWQEFFDGYATKYDDECFTKATEAENALYEAARCLCEGSFGLIGSADDPLEHDLSTLCNISAMLVPGAGFILTALNGLRKLRQYTCKDIASGKYDPVFNVETFVMEYETPEGTKSVTVQECAFVPTELMLMCQCAGFEVLHLWGGTAGAWNRQPLDWEEMEIMSIARKHG